MERPTAYETPTVPEVVLTDGGDAVAPFAGVYVGIDPKWLATQCLPFRNSCLFSTLWKWTYSVDGTTFPSGINGAAIMPAWRWFPLIDYVEGLAEQIGTSWEDIDLPMRSEPYRTFSGNDNRHLAVVFHIEAESALDTGAITESDGKAKAQDCLLGVMFWARWLESLCLPVYSGESSVDHQFAPPPLILSIGKLFVGRVLMTACGIHWLPPFTPTDMLPFGAMVECEFIVARAAPGVYYDDDEIPGLPLLSSYRPENGGLTSAAECRFLQLPDSA